MCVLLSRLAFHARAKVTPPLAVSFISSLLSLASHQLDLHSADLARAASTSPMHGTLLSLRHLFSSIPLASFATLSTPAERRALFVRALKIVERVWEVTAPVLAASAPEGKAETTDTEEARALRVESGAAAAPEDGEGMMVADGSGGPMHKIILSATWRAMKEAGYVVVCLRLGDDRADPHSCTVSYSRRSYVSLQSSVPPNSRASGLWRTSSTLARSSLLGSLGSVTVVPSWRYILATDGLAPPCYCARTGPRCKSCLLNGLGCVSVSPISPASNPADLFVASFACHRSTSSPSSLKRSPSLVDQPVSPTVSSPSSPPSFLTTDLRSKPLSSACSRSPSPNRLISSMRVECML